MRQALALNPLSGGRRNALRAVRLLEQGAETDPDNPIYPYWCGVIYRSFGLWEKAAPCFERALQRRPDHGPSRLELAWVHVQLRDFDRARAVLGDLLSASPDAGMGGATEATASDVADGSAGDVTHDWRLHRLRAILLLERGRAPEAFETYPSRPPKELHVTQWWREYSYLAEAAGGIRGANGDNPLFVLRRLEGRRTELERLLSGDARRGPGARNRSRTEDLHYFRALLARLAAAAGDIDKTNAYRALVPRSSGAYKTILDLSLKLVDDAAREALEKGDLEKAVRMWHEALEENPDDVTRRRWLVHALSRRALELWESGDAARAVELWSQARRRDVASRELLHNLALGFERLGRWADANKCREALLNARSEPSRPETSRRRPGSDTGKVAAGQKTRRSGTDAPGPSDDDCDGADHARERGQALLAMAENAVRADRPGEARRLLEAARPWLAAHAPLLTRAGLLYASIGDGEKALEAAMAALALQPGYEPAVQCLVHATRLPGAKDATALNAIARALHAVPADSPVFRYWRRRTLQHGRKALETGAADDAMEAFASLLLADAGDIDAWLWAGAAHLKRGNPAGADDCFSEAIRLNPDRAETYIELGARFLAEGDRARAEGYFGQAVKTAPGPTTHVTIGELCAHIGVPDLAEHHLRAALTGDKDAEPFLVRSICGLLETGNEERVRPFLEEARKIAPESVQLCILIALQHLRRQEWVEADESLQEALRLAEERRDETLLEHVGFFRQSLILLRTVGQIDERSFQERIRALLEQWLAETAAAEPPSDELTVEPLETLLARVPDPVDRRPLLPPAPGEHDGRDGGDDGADERKADAETDGRAPSDGHGGRCAGASFAPAPLDLSFFLELHVPPAGLSAAG